MKLYSADLFDPKIDGLISKWLCGDLSSAEQREWNQILLYDANFRENLSDLVKVMREKANCPKSQLKNK